MLSLGLSLTGIPVLGRRGPAYDPDALAFFARLTNQPTDTRKKLYSDLIVSLKTAGVWAKLDALYILAAADAQAARQNLVANAYNLTASGSPTFTTDRGYTGDGAAAYLDTGFNGATAGGKFTAASCAIGVSSRSDGAQAGYEIGNASSSAHKLSARSTTANTMRGGLGNTGTLVNFGATTSAIGHFLISRIDANTIRGFQNGATVASVAGAQGVVPSSSFKVLWDSGTAYSSRQLSAAHLSSSLSDVEVGTLYSTLNIYLTAVGAA